MKKIILLILLLLGSIIYPQKTSIFVAGMNLKLDMNKSDVRKMIPSSISVDSSKTINELVLYEKTNKDYKTLLGFISFNKNNRISSISKEWYLNKNQDNHITDVDMMTIIYNMLNNIIGNDVNIRATISINSSSEPSFNEKSIEIRFDKYWSLNIYIFPSNIQITELVSFQ